MGTAALTWLGQSAVAAVLLGLALYLFRKVIETRLIRSVQHEFDTKLTKFKDQLDQEPSRRDSVRGAAFAALLAQRSALAAKRIEAAQALWNVEDPKIRKYLQLTASGEVMSEEYAARIVRCSDCRPFVSPTAWALFAAYSVIVMFAVSRMKTLQLLGFDPRKFLKNVHWIEFIRTALPQDDVSKIGSDSEHGVLWVLGRLEERMVEELQRSLAEGSAGLDSVSDAQRILEATDALEASRVEAAVRKDAPEGILTR
jgi:hypothetical protein